MALFQRNMQSGKLIQIEYKSTAHNCPIFKLPISIKALVYKRYLSTPHYTIGLLLFLITELIDTINRVTLASFLQSTSDNKGLILFQKELHVWIKCIPSVFLFPTLYFFLSDIYFNTSTLFPFTIILTLSYFSNLAGSLSITMAMLNLALVTAT